MRSGTLPHVLVVGLGAACEVCQLEMEVCLALYSVMKQVFSYLICSSQGGHSGLELRLWCRWSVVRCIRQ